MKRPKVPRTGIVIAGYRQHSIFLHAHEVSTGARMVMGMAWNLRAYGANLYRLCDNQMIADIFGWQKQKVCRIKKELRDAGLLPYSGKPKPGCYDYLVKRWEEKTRWTFEDSFYYDFNE